VGAHVIYVSFGSNLGNRASAIEQALAALPGAGVRVLRRSRLYRTAAVDVPQAWFLNGVVEAETALLPLQLLRALRRIERQLGSRKLVRRGPRRIDLDILLYGGAIIRTAELNVPHPRMAERRFVLVPLAELAPHVRHPLRGATIAALLAATADRSTVAPWAND
jgi:2-amino-4-hydroxy-6-hydroxymethyldihydropteridine diphosphokinase